MTMATTTMSTAVSEAGDRPGRSLEELVDRVFEALLGGAPASEEQSLARRVHAARRLRQQDDLDGALALLAGVDLKGATEQEARWAYGEWLGFARRRFSDREGAALYSPATGRAALLAPFGDAGTLEVLAVLGIRWRAGKIVSRRSLRGLRALAAGGS
jgi:hypothetical protein